MLSTTVILVFAGIASVSSLKCLQCNGWARNYPGTTPSPCDNQNNQCQAEGSGLCVRIADPLMGSAPYDTFKLDCWNQANLQVTPSQMSPVVAGQCYQFQDGAVPPKRFRYCFCNSADYCNSSDSLSLHSALIVFFSALLLRNVL